MKENCKRRAQKHNNLKRLYTALFYTKLQKLYRISKHYSNKILHSLKINSTEINTLKWVL
jgi:hypothetical protein